jgi:hypothetical protein
MATTTGDGLPVRGSQQGQADVAVFSVVRRDDGALWEIDAHSRSAHLGPSLLPAYRGVGLGRDMVQVLRFLGETWLGLLAADWSSAR